MISPSNKSSQRMSRALRVLLMTLVGLAGATMPLMSGADAAAHSTVINGAAAGQSTASDAPWVEGKSDQDTIESCVTGGAVTGVMASVAWQPLGGSVPKVGERFTIRATAALVGQPCSGGVTMFPELMAPTGLIYGDDADHPVLWGIRNIDDQVALTSGGLVYEAGSNGGVVLLRENHQPFILRRGQVLEVQVPVIATREMKGMATLQPECLDRRNGVRPCPPEQSGDHFQAAFRVGGHGGNKTYVTPYVGLFAQPAAQTPAPPTSNPTPPTNPTQPGAQQAASQVTAKYQVASRKGGTARVQVRSGSVIPTGKVTVMDGRKKIANATLSVKDKGRITVKLPRLRRGAHRLSVRYSGSATVAPSSTPIRKVNVR